MRQQELFHFPHTRTYRHCWTTSPTLHFYHICRRHHCCRRFLPIFQILLCLLYFHPGWMGEKKTQNWIVKNAIKLIDSQLWSFHQPEGDEDNIEFLRLNQRAKRELIIRNREQIHAAQKSSGSNFSSRINFKNTRLFSQECAARVCVLMAALRTSQEPKLSALWCHSSSNVVDIMKIELDSIVHDFSAPDFPRHKIRLNILSPLFCFLHGKSFAPTLILISIKITLVSVLECVCFDIFSYSALYPHQKEEWV